MLQRMIFVWHWFRYPKNQRLCQRVVELVKAQHEKAIKILTDNRAKLDELAKYLYEKETITGDEFMAILEEKDSSEN